MISETSPTAEPPSSVLTHSWALSVFRVENHEAQQRVLRALHWLGYAGVSAIGAQRDDETFVIIDWDSAADQAGAKQVVMLADRDAATTFTSRDAASLDRPCP